MAPPNGAPVAEGAAGTGAWIGRSARLAKARPVGLSNPYSSRPRGPNSGRAWLLWIALVFVLGLAWLWTGLGERPPRPASAPAAEEPAPEPIAETEMIPAPPSQASPVPAGDAELAPFVAARADTSAFDGRRGSVRGHLEVEGEEPFPSTWRLVLRPSTTLPERERAVSRTLDLVGGQSDFEVADLPLGGYDLFGEAEGFNGQVLPVLLEPGSEHPFVNLRLVAAGTLEGLVLDAHERPAEGIVLTLFAVADNHAREATTDASGIYRFEKLVDGAYELLLGKASAPLLPERHPVRFLAPHLTFPDITLPALGEIQVRVVDSLARPLEGVEVRGSGTNGGVFEGKTDFDGRLVARHLPAGHFRMRLKHPAFEAQYERRIAVDVVAGQVSEAPVRYGP